MKTKIKTEYHENGSVRILSHCFKKLKHGSTKYFEKDGTMICEAIYDMGKRKEMRLFSEGKLFDYTFFTNNKMSYAFIVKEKK